MKFPPTFSRSKKKSITMIIYRDDGTILRYRRIQNTNPYANMYFNLIKNLNTYQALKTWNEWWNNGHLDAFKYDLFVMS
jgi:hypothetical protein